MALSNLISRERFTRIFHELDSRTLNRRFEAFERATSEMGWKPSNVEEIAAFFGHVYHETDGLKTLTEYFLEGDNSRTKYQTADWCKISPHKDRLYYGRGWLQLSYPDNYYHAGNALGVDLWTNPDLVATDEVLACKTAIWFWKANEMGRLAAKGCFGETTRILNVWECIGNPGENLQGLRIARYQHVRQCFDLPPAEEDNVWGYK
ncbi:unnamed protein product [Rotaria sordida]|uniref:Glycoside hydrolase family 19 catalytic domain-containing protein n=1 Tax=Rotaria sordida TaxID=392033 RepID=A0A818PGH6_9BILA|nr:unnamed protein product [Rotaria sordida]CAF3622574.1 unnamed protein product [Rotaria sordida]